MKYLHIAMAILFFLTSSCGVQAASRRVTLGTGAVTGVYYPVGEAINTIVNQQQKKHRIRITIKATEGSVYNVNALIRGDLDLALIQSDLQYQAYKGFNDWAGEPQQKIRTVFALHQETITIVAAADAQIKTVHDLKGKRVNLGLPGSGQRSNALDLFTVANIDPDKDLQSESFNPDESSALLQGRRIDAFFYTAGHPNVSVTVATEGPLKTNFVAVPEDVVVELIRQFPCYSTAAIPVAVYPEVENKADVSSYGVKAILCASADVPDGVVYAITKAVFENLDSFRALHPALAKLTRENMLEGLSAPLHPGAEKYYREAGLL